MLLVESMSCRGILKFSENELNFSYLKHPKFASVVYSEIRVWNLIQKQIDFLIRTDELAPNFGIDTSYIANLEYVVLTDVALIISLQEEEDISIPFVFTPTSKGNFHATLPVYVRGYSDETPFNQIELNGSHPKIIFKCPEEVALLPTPPEEILTQKINISVLNHTRNCSYQIIYDVPEVSVEYTGGNFISCTSLCQDFTAIISFLSTKEFHSRSTMKVLCSCGNRSSEIKLLLCSGKWAITTHIHEFLHVPRYIAFDRTSSKSMMSTFSKSQMAIDTHKFPYFVSDDDESPYADYMRRICNCAERWIFTQVMYCTYYISIPNHINDIFINLKPQESEKNTQAKFATEQAKKDKELLTIVVIIMNLIGPEVRNIIMTRYV